MLTFLVYKILNYIILEFEELIRALDKHNQVMSQFLNKTSFEKNGDSDQESLITDTAYISSDIDDNEEKSSHKKIDKFLTVKQTEVRNFY